jgi:hypothetical protein
MALHWASRICVHQQGPYQVPRLLNDFDASEMTHHSTLTPEFQQLIEGE